MLTRFEQIKPESDSKQTGGGGIKLNFIVRGKKQKDFAALVTLLVWQVRDATENNQLAPETETKSNSKDTEDYLQQLLKCLDWEPVYDLCCWSCSARRWQVALPFLWPLTTIWSQPWSFFLLSNVTGPALTWSDSCTHAS